MEGEWNNGGGIEEERSKCGVKILSKGEIEVK